MNAVIQTDRSQLLLDVSFVISQDLWGYYRRQILILDILQIQVIQCRTKTRCSIKGCHICHTSFRQYPFFRFTGYVTSGTNTHEHPSTITHRRQQRRGNLCYQQIAIWKLYPFYRHNRQWQDVTIRANARNLFQQSIVHLQSRQPSVIIGTYQQITFLTRVWQIIGKSTNGFTEFIHIRSGDRSLHPKILRAMQQCLYFFY